MNAGTEFEIALEQTPAPPVSGESWPALRLARDLGLPITADVLELIEESFEKASVEREAQGLAKACLLLGDQSAVGIAFRRVVLGDREPLREACKRAHVSHVAVWKMERQMRARLTKITIT